MMNAIWGGMVLVAVIVGLISGQAAPLSDGIMRAAMEAVQFGIQLAGGFALWCGLIEILSRAGVMRALARALAPVLRKLFKGLPEDGKAAEAIATNLAANMLGLGNAATPMGIKAMRLMAEAAPGARVASEAMIMFLVINASSVQLFPSTVVAMRAALGSENPGWVVLPTLIVTVISTVVGVVCCRAFGRGGAERRQWRIKRSESPVGNKRARASGHPTIANCGGKRNG